MDRTLDPGLVVGVGSMDREHEHMSTLVRELQKAVLQAFPPAVVDGLLNVLLAATRRHFATEEQLMARYGYPREQPHKAAHAALLEDLKTMIRQNLSQPLDLSTAQSLERWLTHHIATLDRDLGEHVSASGGAEA